MSAKYFVVISIIYLQTTMSDPLGNKFRRRYFPATRSGYHGYRRRPFAPGGLRQNPPGGGPPGKGPQGKGPSGKGIKGMGPSGGGGLPNIPQAALAALNGSRPSGMTQDQDREVEDGPSTVWAPQPAYRENMTEQCDYIAHYCMKAYTTGEVCGRTVLYGYYTFKSYCMLDYANCMRQFDAWMLVHMGPCFNITFPADYLPPDRGGEDLAPELLKNMVLGRVADLQAYKRGTDDY